MNDVAINTAATFSSRTALTLEAAQKLLVRCHKRVLPHVNYDEHWQNEDTIDFMEQVLYQNRDYSQSSWFRQEIYIITFEGDDSRIKIGLTKNFSRRIDTYRTHTGRPIKVLARIPILDESYGAVNRSGRYFENKLHSLVERSLIPYKREWFEYTDQVDQTLKIIIQYLQFTEYTIA